MLSKLLAPNSWGGLRSVGLLRLSPAPRRQPGKVISVRYAGDLIPPTQYDIPISKKFKFTHAMVEYWELIPMFVTVSISMLILFIAIAWASKNKVDVVFSTHSRDNISRTMDLRNPSAHKMVMINQRYEPWPEMQRVLDRLKFAEKRELSRKQKCYPS